MKQTQVTLSSASKSLLSVLYLFCHRPAWVCGSAINVSGREEGTAVIGRRKGGEIVAGTLRKVWGKN